MKPTRPLAATRYDPERMFRPRSLAVFGAEGRVGRQLQSNLAEGGFAWPIQILSPGQEPQPADLAIFRRGCRADCAAGAGPSTGRHLRGRVARAQPRHRGRAGGDRCAGAGTRLVWGVVPGAQPERHAVPSGAAAGTGGARLAIGGVVPGGCWIGLGQTALGFSQLVGHWRKCRHRVRPGAGLPVPRFRNRPDPAGHPPHPRSAPVPVGGPCRRPAATGRGAAGRQPPAGPEWPGGDGVRRRPQPRRRAHRLPAWRICSPRWRR